MHERHLLDRVRHLARLTGWRTYHTHDSRRSEPGFPDLVLIRGPHLIFAELKGEAPRGRLTPPQADWLAALSLASSVTAEVWRPNDWPRIATLLRRRPLPATLGASQPTHQVHDQQVMLPGECRVPEVLPQSPVAPPCSECGRGFEPSNGVPRWDADPQVLKCGWLAHRCGNCGASSNATITPKISSNDSTPGTLPRP